MQTRRFLLNSGLTPEEVSVYLSFMKILEEPLGEMEVLFRRPAEALLSVLEALRGKGLVEETGEGWRARDWESQEWLTPERIGGIEPALSAAGMRSVRNLLKWRCRPYFPVVAPRENPEALESDSAMVRFVNSIFPSLDLRLGTACNVRCRYCLLGTERRTPQMKREEVLSAYGAGRSLHLEKIVLTGGEPTIRRDLAQLIADARAAGYRHVHLNTNALMFKYPDTYAPLREAGLDSIGFSLDTVDAEIADALFQRPGMGAVLLEGVDNLFARCPELSCIAVVTKHNMDHLDAVVDYFADRMHRHETDFFLTFDFVSPESSAWVNRRELVPTLREAAVRVSRALERAEHLGVPAAFRNIPLCLMRGMEPHALDDVMHIFHMVMSDNDKYEFNTDYKDCLFLHADTCPSCRHYGSCQGVPFAYVEMFGADEFRPVTGGAA